MAVPKVGLYRVEGDGHLQHKRRRYTKGDVVEMDIRFDRKLVDAGRLVYVGPVPKASDDCPDKIPGERAGAPDSNPDPAQHASKPASKRGAKVT